MSILVYVIGVLGMVSLVVLFAVKQRMKAAEKQKYFRAAQRIIREQHLDGAIRNADRDGSFYEERRIMLILKIKGSKGLGYVFDPSRDVQIGRSTEGNDVCVQDLSVSSKHCKIFLYEGQLCIKDLDSTNGTVIKPRWRKKERLFGTIGFLYNKTRIWAGDICFVVSVFYCDAASD